MTIIEKGKEIFDDSDKNKEAEKNREEKKHSYEKQNIIQNE